MENQHDLADMIYCHGIFVGDLNQKTLRFHPIVVDQTNKFGDVCGYSQRFPPACVWDMCVPISRPLM